MNRTGLPFSFSSLISAALYPISATDRLVPVPTLKPEAWWETDNEAVPLPGSPSVASELMRVPVPARAEPPFKDLDADLRRE